MITIETRESINLTTKQSLFVSFDYSLDHISKIKSLPKRHYIPTTKEWEVPIKSINDIVSLFSNTDIAIKGKVPPKVAKAVNDTAKFEDTNSEFQFKTKCFDHQLECFNYGKTHNKFLLGDEQGLGKTKQAIDLACSRKNLFKHTLIVCGVNGLKWNWVNEIQTHSNEAGHILGSKLNSKGILTVGSVKDRLKDLETEHNEFFLITNIETLRDTNIVNKLQDMCRKGIIGMVIADEIHRMSNPSSQQTKGFLKLNSFYKMALTGTQIKNSPLDAFVTLKWLDVEQHAFYSFKSRYCVMGGYGGYEVLGYKNMQELRDKIDSIQLRRLKDDCLDLPDKTYINEYVEMSEKQKQLYNQVLLGIKSEIDQIKLNPNPLAQLSRLRQVTGLPQTISSKVTDSAKLNRLFELLEDNKDGKTIIFSNWTSITDVLQQQLQKYNPAIVTGKTNDRMEEMDKFQNNDTCKIIIGTIGAMGTGFTLTSANQIIFFDEPWNRATKDQAIDRAHRIGQKNNVTVITLLARNTIDEKINEIVEEKGLIADALVDGQMEKLQNSKLLDFLLS